MIRFGDCLYDDEARELKRGGRAVELTPRAFDLLGALLESRPRALSKSDLRDRLWPDSAVGDTSLTKLVAEVRRAIGDDAREPRFVRTVHRFGYAFCGEVAEVGRSAARGAAPGCSVLVGNREVPLRIGENMIGRGPGSVVRLGSQEASRQHARIVVREGGAMLEDLGSKNGTRLNDQRVEGSAPLTDGDRIGIGRLELIFVAAAGTTRTTPAS